MTTLNDIERLDNLLLKVDAVRFALPAVIHSISQAAAVATAPSTTTSQYGSASTSAVLPSPEARVSQYRKNIQQVNDRLDELQQGSASLEDLLKRFQPSHDGPAVPAVRTERIRVDHFSHRRLASSPSRLPKQRYVPFPSKSSQKSDLESVAKQLEKEIGLEAAAHPALRLRSNLSRENSRVFSVELPGIALFHVILTLRKASGTLVFQRVNAFGIKEEKRPHDTSDQALWREASHQITDAMKSGTRQAAGLNLDSLFSLLSSYADLYESPCSLPSCRRLLHPKTFLLPTARLYSTGVKAEPDASAATASASNGKWHPFHSNCISQAATT